MDSVEDQIAIERARQQEEFKRRFGLSHTALNLGGAAAGAAVGGGLAALLGIIRERGISGAFNHDPGTYKAAVISSLLKRSPEAAELIKDVPDSELMNFAGAVGNRLTGSFDRAGLAAQTLAARADGNIVDPVLVAHAWNGAPKSGIEGLLDALIHAERTAGKEPEVLLKTISENVRKGLLKSTAQEVLTGAASLAVPGLLVGGLGTLGAAAYTALKNKQALEQKRQELTMAKTAGLDLASAYYDEMTKLAAQMREDTGGELTSSVPELGEEVDQGSVQDSTEENYPSLPIVGVQLQRVAPRGARGIPILQPPPGYIYDPNLAAFRPDMNDPGWMPQDVAGQAQANQQWFASGQSQGQQAAMGGASGGPTVLDPAQLGGMPQMTPSPDEQPPILPAPPGSPDPALAGAPMDPNASPPGQAAPAEASAPPEKKKEKPASESKEKSGGGHKIMVKIGKD